jgi:type II secretory pathway component GspD/PulD (secretin)
MRLRQSLISATCISMLPLATLVFPQSADLQQKRVTVNFQNVDLRVVIDAMSKQFGKRILLEPTNRTVVTWKTGTLTNDDAYKEFVRLLIEHDLSVTEDPDGAIRVASRSTGLSK